MSERLHEKCAVAAASLNDEAVSAAPYVYDTLFALQHRGTEASGITTNDSAGQMESKKGLGMVKDVFQAEDFTRLLGSCGIGHNRYSTSGNKNDHFQPVVDEPMGFAFAHNGNLPDVRQLRRTLEKQGLSVNKRNDSELAGLAIAYCLRGKDKDLPAAVERTYPFLSGAFSCVAMHRNTVVAFRDQYGIRPLELGQLEDGMVVSSETCGLDIVGAQPLRAVNPGEMVVIEKGEIVHETQLAVPTPKFDMFEYVYFARPDSYLGGKRVSEVRRSFGESLAYMHPPTEENGDDIVVIPVPDTSTPAAEGYASAIGLHYEQAIIKNRYIGRTFMQVDQRSRQHALKRKHSIISERVEGKHVYLIDDSIVRLNTMPNIVAAMYAAKAKSVSVLIASAPVRFPDFYGIDTPDQKELAAATMTVEQMREKIGARYLGFLSISAMVDATSQPYSQFNLASFNGEYPIDIGEHKNSIVSPVSYEYME